MQRFLIHITKGLEAIICVLNWVFNICVAILATGCISTFLYHTTHREEWRVFMVILFCCMIAYLVLVIAEGGLIALVKTEDKSVIISRKRIDLVHKTTKIEAHILLIVFIVVIEGGRKMLNGGVQVFTGDPWWTAVYSVSFRILFLFYISKILHCELICEPLLKATAQENAPGDAEELSPSQGEE